MDIIYVPMARGWVYLTVVLDWYSRKVLAWRLSISMDVDFCIEAVQEAIARWGCPEIFNTDQGSQGGFNRSSQHLQPGGVYGTTRRLDEAIDRERRDALSGCAFAST